MPPKGVRETDVAKAARLQKKSQELRHRDTRQNTEALLRSQPDIATELKDFLIDGGKWPHGGNGSGASPGKASATGSGGKADIGDSPSAKASTD